MNKRYLHHVRTRIRPVKVWYLLAAFLVSGGICVVGLRSNYVTMTHVRAAVYKADQDNGNVEQALQNLRAFVGSHMNTSLATDDGVYPPIQLKYTYQRLQQAEQDRVSSINSHVYTDAQSYCQATHPTGFSGGSRVPCIEQYVQDHGTTAQAIPNDIYKFNFASPTWSPDLAGLMLVLAVFCLALTALRVLLGYLLEALTR